MKRWYKFLFLVAATSSLAVLLLWIYLYWFLEPTIPQVEQTKFATVEREKAGENFYTLGRNFLKKNEFGLWEEYVEGEAFERGVVLGKLNKELLYKQEAAFVEQIDKLVPNKNYQRFLAYFTRFFNRDLCKHFPLENQKEIYGESLAAPHEFDYIAAPFDRMLNYHAAHDIGHALQNFALVGCTSFGIWGDRVDDSTMIIGRNLDFSLGDKFAEDKIVLFMKPDSGYRFAMVTWAGFMGCVSGMNEHGLTVTINAAKSDVPVKATTPIALLARQILQYAKNINEAFLIAQQHQTFVCETFMIGSAEDKQTALIEKSISQTVLLKSDTNFIVCANHFQSKAFQNDKANLENIQKSTSLYRQHRTLELMQQTPQFSAETVSGLLRNQKGLNGKNIGIGNEKAINQLISHHAVIFKPQKRLMWVSANPYQLGTFVCYDLNKVFSHHENASASLCSPEMNVPADTFLFSAEWKKFLDFKAMKKTILQATAQKKALPNEQSFIESFIQSNQELWETYAKIGNYFLAIGNKPIAKKYFQKALQKDVASKQDEEKLKELLRSL